jgi:hypothetical protein
VSDVHCAERQVAALASFQKSRAAKFKPALALDEHTLRVAHSTVPVVKECVRRSEEIHWEMEEGKKKKKNGD